jgi:hypothetical protein
MQHDTLWHTAMDSLRAERGLGYSKHLLRLHKGPRIAFQAAMKKAQRFVLDRGFIRAAVAASTLEPRILAERLHLMRPPFPLTWIEWDEAERLNALQEVGYAAPDEPGTRLGVTGTKALRVGMLVQEGGEVKRLHEGGLNIKAPPVLMDAGTYSMIPAMTVYDKVGGKFILDVSGLSIAWSSAPLPDALLPATERNLTLRAALGPAYAERTGIPLDASHPLARHISAGLGGPFAELTLKAMLYERERGKATILPALLASAAGDWRFLAAVLLLWNVRGATLEAPMRRRPSTGGGQLSTGDEYHVAKLILPAPTRHEDGRSGQPSGRAAPRQHVAQGHWCHSRKHPGKTWWRRSSVRGDASRGTISKTYMVTAPPPA